MYMLVYKDYFRTEYFWLILKKSRRWRTAYPDLLGDRDSNPNKQDQNLLSYR